MAKNKVKPEELVQVHKDSLEAMADNIKVIADSVRGAYGHPGQLTLDALITLIQRKIGSGGPSRRDIHNVIWALGNLEDGTLVPEPVEQLHDEED